MRDVVGRDRSEHQVGVIGRNIGQVLCALRTAEAQVVDLRLGVGRAGIEGDRDVTRAPTKGSDHRRLDARGHGGGVVAVGDGCGRGAAKTNGEATAGGRGVRLHGDLQRGDIRTGQAATKVDQVSTAVIRNGDAAHTREGRVEG